MRVLLVGLGSIGRRHIANLGVALPWVELAVWRRSESRPADAGLAEVYSLQDALATEPTCALITGPASRHVEVGLALARSGVHLFVEKPISDGLDGVPELIAECRDRSLVLMVGYNFRFDAALGAMKSAIGEGRIGRPLLLRAEVGQYLPDWRPGIDYRESVSAQKSLGGGVVLELSHELDYARWLIGEVDSVSAEVSDRGGLGIDVEDTCEAILSFKNGVVGNVHLDMVDRALVRRCRVVGTEGTVTWDGGRRSARLFAAGSGGWTDLHPGTVDPNEMYVAELRHFFDCVAGEAAPLVGGEDGLRALQIALAVKASAAAQRTVRL